MNPTKRQGVIPARKNKIGRDKQINKTNPPFHPRPSEKNGELQPQHGMAPLFCAGERQETEVKLLRWTYDRCARWEVVWEDTTANDAITNVMTERKGRWKNAAEGMDAPRGGKGRRSAPDGGTTPFSQGNIFYSEG